MMSRTELDVVSESAPTPATTAPPVAVSEPILLTEIVVLGLCVVAATTAWVALFLAQARVFSLHAVVAGVAVSLGVFIAIGLRRRPRFVRRWPVAVLAGATLMAGLFMFLPGFPYVVGDRDPGNYVIHGASIERHGTIDIPDEVGATVPDTTGFGPESRFLGLNIGERPDEVTPSFYHLYPSLLAVANAIGGLSLSFHVNAVLATLSVMAVALAVRRVAGLTAGALVAGFLVVNMLQVWQAKYPTTEILTQMSITGALLGAAVTMRTGWRPAAGAAGLLTGMAFLARPDGLVFVLLGLAAAALAVALSPRDRRTWWYLGGLAVPLLHGLVNAYVIRRAYSLNNGLPPLAFTLGVIGLLAAGSGAVLLARRRSERLDGLLDPTSDHWRSWARTASVGLATVATLVLLGFWARDSIFGEDTLVYTGRVVRSFDEVNLQRLSWFWPAAGMVLGVVGIAALGFWRRRASTWLVSLVLLPAVPLYLYEAKVAPKLLWWGRRYVPGVLPVLLILAAVGAAWMLTRGRWWLKVPVGAVVVVLLAQSLALSWPLRAHREYGGSQGFNRELAELTGDGVVLWEKPSRGIFALSRNIPQVQWLVHDVDTAYVDPEDPGGSIADVAAAFPDRPLYLVVEDGEIPVGVLPSSLELIDVMVTDLPFWERTEFEVPDEAEALVRGLEVYRVVG